MNFTPPPIDILRGAVLGVIGTFWPMMDGVGLINLNDAQLAMVDGFTVSVALLVLLFYNPQRDN